MAVNIVTGRREAGCRIVQPFASVRDTSNIYYMSSKKIVIERTRDLFYLKFVATDFSQK